jgi:omega-amidase
MSSLTVSLVQANLGWEQPENNLAMFDQLLTNLPPHTDLVVLPEMFTTGFSMNTSLAAQYQDAIDWLQHKAKGLQIPICGSLMVKELGQFYNRFIWVNPDGTMHTYNKRHLFRMGQEHLHYTAGSQRMLIEYKDWKLFPFVCYDLRFPVWLRRTQAFNYDAMICVANWPTKRIQHWQTLLQARAIENQTYVLACNRVGIDGNQVPYSGYSGGIDVQGNWIQQEVDNQVIITITLEKEPLESWRSTFPAIEDGDAFAVF